MPTIASPKAIQKKSRTHLVTPTGPNSYTVTSGASGNTYNVHVTPSTGSGRGPSGGTCSCKWAQYRPTGDHRSGCSHVVAVFDYIAQNDNRTVSAWSSREQAQRQHRPNFSIGDGVTLTLRKAA